MHETMAESGKCEIRTRVSCAVHTCAFISGDKFFHTLLYRPTFISLFILRCRVCPFFSVRLRLWEVETGHNTMMNYLQTKNRRRRPFGMAVAQPSGRRSETVSNIIQDVVPCWRKVFDPFER